jgi:hypothetical protein
MTSVNSVAPQQEEYYARRRPGPVKRALENAAIFGTAAAVIQAPLNSLGQRAEIKAGNLVKFDWARLGKSCAYAGALCAGFSLVLDGLFSLIKGRSQ